MKIKKILVFFLLILFLSKAEARDSGLSGISGVFIQLDYSYIEKTTDDWRLIFQKLSNLKIDTVIIQWIATDDIVYFESSLNYSTRYKILEKIIAEARKTGINVYLGLHHESTYWTQITAPVDILEDFFYKRTAINERLIKDLVNKFGNEEVFAGYYIPDEIDDLRWRSPERIKMYNNYLKLLVKRIRIYDKKRPIAISAFVRSRTSPKIFAENLFNILEDTGINILCIQDGGGENDPSEYYRRIYFEYIKKLLNKGHFSLWGIVEAFSNIKQKDGVITANPAPEDRIKRQIKTARDYFKKIIVFSLRYL